MKREIKFRVWDKQEQRMRYLNDPHDAIYFTYNGDARYINYQNGSGGDEYELMQFTGLTDKNGKKIYEGDLFKIGAEKQIFEVRFEHGCFMAYYNDKQYGLVGELQICFIDVVGTIHNNPELIK